ncbi:MAG: serpin family protein, partial [Deltaproteobacteria bacterium]|nr:serpin family protein [Deltaproteobacteria bacterium]
PRFEMRFYTPLKAQLEALGMGLAFDSEQADFSGITNTGMFIAEVVHEAYVKVDEEGTEAAAATAVVMEDSAVGDMFYADHPFLFLIRDDLTGSILFMGRVVDPS